MGPVSSPSSWLRRPQRFGAAELSDWSIREARSPKLVIGLRADLPDTAPRTWSAPAAVLPQNGRVGGGAGRRDQVAEAAIAITNFDFSVPVSVAPGGQVTINNGDTQAHTVTSKTGGFDVTVNPKRTATLIAPSTPGSYPFTCSFHGNMTGTLVVQ
ncbi:MAG: cupredoxin domain-containing protein [Ornithinibacter sp.]